MSRLALWGRRISNMLLLAFAALYVAGKVHFFRRGDSPDYISEHSPIWLGMLVVVVLMWIAARFVGRGQPASPRPGDRAGRPN